MKVFDRDRESARNSLAQMTPSQKLRYFFDYYTVHFLLAVLALVIAVTSAVRLASKKNAVLYLGLTNAAVGSELEERLTTDFIEKSGFDKRKSEVSLYKDLVISADPAAENHEYAYASQLKVMAAINAEKLDLVLMTRESYDVFSGKGYLADLSSLLKENNASGLENKLEPFLTKNDVILSDNYLETALGESEELVMETEQIYNAVNVSGFPVFLEAGFQADVFIGVIGNTKRIENVLKYLDYLAAD